MTALNRKILVGMKGNAHTNLQALAVFASEGFHAVFSVDPKEEGLLTISLYKGDELVKAASGPTYPVCLRRLFEETGSWKPELFTEEPEDG